jgi:hypothetical protein
MRHRGSRRNSKNAQQYIGRDLNFNEPKLRCRCVIVDLVILHFSFLCFKNVRKRKKSFFMFQRSQVMML